MASRKEHLFGSYMDLHGLATKLRFSSPAILSLQLFRNIYPTVHFPVHEPRHFILYFRHCPAPIFSMPGPTVCPFWILRQFCPAAHLLADEFHLRVASHEEVCR